MFFLRKVASITPAYLRFAIGGVTLFFLVAGLITLDLGALSTFFSAIVAIVIHYISREAIELSYQRKNGNSGVNVPPLVAEAILRMVFSPRYQEFVIRDINERFYEIVGTDGISAARRYYWWEIRVTLLEVVITSVGRFFLTPFYSATNSEEQKKHSVR